MPKRTTKQPLMPKRTTKLSVKSKIQATTIALVLAGALGFYYLGRGGKLDTSQDRDILLSVRVDATRASPATIVVSINGAERSREGLSTKFWSDHMWIRPGETVMLTGQVEALGTITCTIIDRGVEHVDVGGGEGYFENNLCRVKVTG